MKLLKVDHDLHRKLKCFAVLQNQTMLEITNKAIEQYIEGLAAPTPQPKPTQAQNQLNPNIIEHSPGCISVLCD